MPMSLLKSRPFNLFQETYLGIRDAKPPAYANNSLSRIDVRIGCGHMKSIIKITLNLNLIKTAISIYLESNIRYVHRQYNIKFAIHSRAVSGISGSRVPDNRLGYPI